MFEAPCGIIMPHDLKGQTGSKKPKEQDLASYYLDVMGTTHLQTESEWIQINVGVGLYSDNRTQPRLQIYTVKQEAKLSLGQLTVSPHSDSRLSIVISYYCEIAPSAFFKIRALSVLGSRLWPFVVTWRHRSHDHSIHRPIPICFFRQFFGRRTV